MEVPFVASDRLQHTSKNDIPYGAASYYLVAATMPKKNQPPTWKNSKAKNLLEEDLISGAIPLDSDDMKLMDVYHQRPEFSHFVYAHFRDRLRDLRRQIKDKNDRATSDSAALAHGQQIYPKATHNHRGEPPWEGLKTE